MLPESEPCVVQAEHNLNNLGHGRQDRVTSYAPPSQSGQCLRLNTLRTECSMMTLQVSNESPAMDGLRPFELHQVHLALAVSVVGQQVLNHPSPLESL